MATGRNHSSGENIDRFIPNRSAMDFGFAHCMLTQSNQLDKKNFTWSWLPNPLSRENYKEKLAVALGVNHSRILAFKNKPKHESLSPTLESTSSKRLRDIPQRPCHMLKALGLRDDSSLNLMDWSSSNIFCIALEHTICLWNPLDDSFSEVVTFNDEDGPVTSISWAPDGRRLAIGLFNSRVQLWDTTTTKLLRTFRHGRQGQVGSLAWNDHLLTTGGADTQIINNDVRIKSHVVASYEGHSGEISGLKWADSGERLASGGKDRLIYIWDRSMASSKSSIHHTQWLHKLAGHRGRVNALAWCPFRLNLLASGGGGDNDDNYINFWNTCTGTSVNSIDTGSQVSALLWNKKEHELLSSHGSPHNQLILWKYPCMVKMAELTGHVSGVLSMAENPNGCTVASAAADGTVRLWDVFGNSRAAKPMRNIKASPHEEPFAANYFNRIR
ncbi:cell division cycle 20.2, cofactor of APC complex-like [Prosopis cineraria]|uniref:cell division cycle 20.2, cofactor of APC complex-like n=1 Tax=Prosopis cineraria TaxID=364024 RepID=UPI00240FA02B|nr:cell division cycle 20.2, cofactor of APC complex-like [Prosopis cineraria]